MRESTLRGVGVVARGAHAWQAPSSSPAYHDIPRASLDREGVVKVAVGDDEILAVSTPDGIRVYSGVCPHLGGPLLEGEIREGVVRCPWHDYRFDLASAKCLTVPGGPWRALVGERLPDEPYRGNLVPLKFELTGDQIRVYLRKP